jgi:putative endonuclease
MPHFAAPGYRGGEVRAGSLGGRKDAVRAFSGTTRPVPAAPHWYVYLLRCGDGSLYAGATTDVTARLAAHREGKGARYTRGRGPLLLVLCERHRDRSAALRREHELKRLRRAEKLALLRARRPVARA